MSDSEKTVFISYRRNVSSFIARAVFMDLRIHGYDVFLDVETIDSGTFASIILNQIAARANFLVILTPGTIERCIQPGDWLRREVEHAIDLQRNIIPLLINNFTFSNTEHFLTGKLEQLQHYNAVTVPHEYFDAAMARLRTRYLKSPANEIPIAPAPVAEVASIQQKMASIERQAMPTPKQLSAESYFNRGIAEKATGNLDSAIANYERAIEINPQYSAAYINRGVARKDKLDLDGAIADFSEAIRLTPKVAETYYNRGHVRKEKRDFQGTIEDYQRYLDLGGGRKHGNQAKVEQFIRRLKKHL